MTRPPSFRATASAASAHLGDGNIHLHVRAPEGAEPEAWLEERGDAVRGLDARPHRRGRRLDLRRARHRPPEARGARAVGRSGAPPRCRRNSRRRWTRWAFSIRQAQPVRAKRRSTLPRLPPATPVRNHAGQTAIHPKGPTMASAPAAEMPILFNDLVPLSSDEHADWRLAPRNAAPFLKAGHAVPLTVDEFVAAQPPLSDRLLRGRAAGADRAVRPQRGGERVPGRRRPLASNEIYVPRLHPPLSVHAGAAARRQRADVLVHGPRLRRAGRRGRGWRGVVRRVGAQRRHEGVLQLLRAVRAVRPAAPPPSWTSWKRPG